MAIYIFYANVLSCTTDMMIDTETELGISNADWEKLSESDKDKHISKLFREYLPNLCDQGWYLKDKET